MIEFKDLNYEDSAIIYHTTLEQIKKVYQQNPQQAGELAIAAIEVALTGGEHSSNDYFVDVILEQNKYLSTKNIEQKQKKLDAQKEKRIVDLQLREIVALLNQGFNQTQIGSKLGVSKQAISKRMIVLRSDFPELLSTKSTNDNLSQSKSIDESTSQLKEVDDNLTEETLVDEVDNLSTKVDNQQNSSRQFDNQVNQVNPNVNVNVNENVNISQVSSNEETLPLISRQALNQMGATYKDLGNGVIETATGKKMKLDFKYDF